MAPRSKRRNPRTDAAEHQAFAAYRAIAAHDAARRGLVVARAEAIQQALDEGSTLARLAEIFGVTEGRIRQIREGPE